jgi:hypothetical protein
MECHFCKEANNRYACDKCSVTMIPKQDLFTKYKFVTEDVRNLISYVTDSHELKYERVHVYNHVLKKIESATSSKDKNKFAKIRHKLNEDEKINSLINNKKNAIRFILTTAFKKLDQQYINLMDEYSEQYIDQMCTEVEKRTPAELAIIIFGLLDIDINDEKRYKKKEEDKCKRQHEAYLFITSLNSNFNFNFKDFSYYNEYIEGNVDYISFTTQAMSIINQKKRQLELDKLMIENIPKNYLYVCKNIPAYKIFVYNGNIANIDKTIIQIKDHVKALDIYKGVEIKQKTKKMNESDLFFSEIF